MKTQIRRGVFETNSSSTHSLQLAKQTLDEARKAVNKRIYDRYSWCEDVIFDESELTEEPFETVDSFDNEQTDDDIPTVEKLLENQDTASILESDKEAFER